MGNWFKGLSKASRTLRTRNRLARLRGSYCSSSQNFRYYLIIVALVTLRMMFGIVSFRPVWVCIGLHTFLFTRLHGTGLKVNLDRPDFVSVADLTRVTFVPVSWLYRPHVKRKWISTGSINSMFLRMAPSLLPFLSKIRTLLWITVNKTWK